MRPLFSYYGGKQTIAKRIVSLLPKHHHYVEPFAGGAAVFFMKGPLGGPSTYTETLNDLNSNIISLYRTLQSPDKKEVLFDRLRWTPYSHDEWDLAREIYRSNDATSLDERGQLLFSSHNHFPVSVDLGAGPRAKTRERRSSGGVGFV